MRRAGRVLQLLAGPVKTLVKIDFDGKTVELMREGGFGASVSEELSGVGLVLEESEKVFPRGGACTTSEICSSSVRSNSENFANPLSQTVE